MVGTILMVAVTVALGATVLAIMSGVGKDDVAESTNAVWQATAFDTDNDGKTDAVRLSYINGPADVLNADVDINLVGGTITADSRGAGATDWSPGDFLLVDGSGTGAQTVTIVVSLLGTTVWDHGTSLDE